MIFPSSNPWDLRIGNIVGWLIGSPSRSQCSAGSGFESCPQAVRLRFSIPSRIFFTKIRGLSDRKEPLPAEIQVCDESIQSLFGTVIGNALGNSIKAHAFGVLDEPTTSPMADLFEQDKRVVIACSNCRERKVKVPTSILSSLSLC